MHVNRDVEHLRLLAIFHYVFGGIIAFFGLIPIIHVGMGIAMVSGAFSGGSGPPPPPFMGWFFIAIGGGIIVFFEALAVLNIMAGRSLSKYRSRTFCFVVACIDCLNVPLGTTLGVFTILVLTRDSVRQLFDGNGDRPEDFYPQPLT